jgi:hypothetical protein
MVLLTKIVLAFRQGSLSFGLSSSARFTGGLLGLGEGLWRNCDWCNFGEPGSGVLVLGYPLKIRNSKDYMAIKFNPKAKGRRIRAFWDTRTEEKFKR